MNPQRIQRKRTKGAKLPAGTICVTRPGQWSNPFTIEEEKEAVLTSRKEGAFFSADIETLARAQVVRKFREMMHDPYSHPVMPEIRQRFIWMREHIQELRGKNLACYCGLDQECHAEILLALTNVD